MAPESRFQRTFHFLAASMKWYLKHYVCFVSKSLSSTIIYKSCYRTWCYKYQEKKVPIHIICINIYILESIGTFSDLLKCSENLRSHNLKFKNTNTKTIKSGFENSVVFGLTVSQRQSFIIKINTKMTKIYIQKVHLIFKPLFKK